MEGDVKARRRRRRRRRRVGIPPALFYIIGR